jgi:pyruvate dehydrogenase E2 component (dihydrolipoamide acetyltransferase)
MAESLLMIALSPTMTEGSIARWKVKENQSFSSGDLLCEVETDKASMDYEAPKSAALLKILVPEGGKAAVGQAIALIGKPGEKTDTLSLQAAKTETPKAGSAEKDKPKAGAAGVVAAEMRFQEQATIPGAERKAAQHAPVAPAGYPRSSPLARKIALELGVDLRLVRGRGPEGRVTEKDVREFAAAPFPATTAAEPENGGTGIAPNPRRASAKPVGMKRAVIAKRLSESFFNAPHYYLRRELRVDRLMEARAEFNQGREKPISLNAMLIKLAASVLSRQPQMNVYWRGDSLEERKAVDIGLAVALPDGLITPVVRDCDRKGLEEIDRELSALIEKAKTKGLTPEEYEGAGFTITNLGGFGVDEFTAIINPPGSAILAVGAIRKKPVVVENDEICVARTLVFTLGCDHRSIDGATGAAFLADLAMTAENPVRVIL